MKLIKWILVAVISCVLCVVSVFLIRKAVTPSQPGTRLVPASAQAGHSPVSRVPIETVSNTRNDAVPTRPSGGATSPTPTPFVAPTPIGKLPAPGIVAEQKHASERPTVAAGASPTPSVTPTPTPQFVFDVNVQRAQQFLAQLGYSVGRADGKLGPRTEAALEAFQREHALARTKKPDSATLAKLEEEVKRRTVAANTKVSSATVSARSSSTSETASASTSVAARPRRLGEPQLLLVKGGPKDPEFGAVPKLDNRADVVRVQKALSAAGFYKDEIDGRWGKASLAALEEFQKSLGTKPNAKLDQETWQKLVTASGPTPTPLPDMLVVAPVSKTLKKSKLTNRLTWFTPSPEATPVAAAAPAPQPGHGSDASALSPAAQPSSKSTAASKPAPASAGQSPPVIRPAAVAPAATPLNDVAGTGQPEEGRPQPTNAAPPAPTGSSLDVASANSVEFSPSAATRATNGVPVLLPRSPNERGNGTYADAVALNSPQAAQPRIATVAREANPSRLLTETGDSSTTGASGATSDPHTLADRLRAAARELEQTAPKSKREQAEEKVRAVESVFNDLKRRWSDKFKSGAVADQIASVESGFKAMKSDFQKGEYDRIIARGDGFKRAIEIVSAHAYVASMLNKPEVRAKIPKSDLQAIETLRREAERNPERLDRQEKFLDAAALIKSRLDAAGSSPRAQAKRESKTAR